MSIWSVLLEALRNEEHSELIGDEVAIRRTPSKMRPVSMDKRRIDKILSLLQKAEQKSLTRTEIKTLLQLMREYTVILQKQEHELMLHEAHKLHLK